MPIDIGALRAIPKETGELAIWGRVERKYSNDISENSKGKHNDVAKLTVCSFFR